MSGNLLHTNSPLHRTDPASRILSSLPPIALGAATQSLMEAAALITVSAILALLARLNPRTTLRHMLGLNLFMLLLWLTLPFSVPGHSLFNLAPFSPSLEGIQLVLLLTLKANAIGLFTLTLISTIPSARLADTLRRLGLPQRLTLLIYLFYRYLGIMTKEYNHVTAALKARGFTPRLAPHTLKTYAAMVGILFIRSHEQAEKAWKGLLMRDFQGSFPSSSMQKAPFQMHNATLPILSIVTITIITCIP